MNILAILIAVVIDRFASGLTELRRYESFVRLAETVQSAGGGWFNGTVGLLLSVLVPVAVIAWIQDLVAGGLFGIPALLFGLAVLLFCLGPRDLAADVDEYCRARVAGDEDGAMACAHQIAGVSIESHAPTDRLVINGILARALSSMFSVIFWFTVLGPMGAVLYRATRVLALEISDRVGGDMQRSASILLGILDWIPARLAALAYALSGHFDGAFRGWRDSAHYEHGLETSSIELLIETGNGALGLAADSTPGLQQVDEAMSLVWRAVIVWLVVLAVLILAGWAD